MNAFTRARIVAAVIAATIVSACGSQPTATMPAVNAPSANVQPQAGPAACKGQKTTKKYSSVAETLLGKDASLCIPTFAGLGGALAYPAAKPSGKVTVTFNHDRQQLPLPRFWYAGILFGNCAPSRHDVWEYPARGYGTDWEEESRQRPITRFSCLT